MAGLVIIKECYCYEGFILTNFDLLINFRSPMDWSPKKRKRDEVADDLSPNAKRVRTDSSSDSHSSGSPVSGEEYNAKPQFLDDKTCVQIRDEIYRIGDCVWLHRDQSYTSVVHRGTGEEQICLKLINKLL